MIDIEKLSASVPRCEEEYLGQDGLLHCKKCGEPTQYRVKIEGLGIDRIVRCICSCKVKERDAEEEQILQEKRERNRRECFNGSKQMKSTFDYYEDNEYMNIGRNYVKNFKQFKASGKGLLLHGTVGTGKSEVAACIANALIDEGYLVLMTNFATMVNRLQETFDGKQQYIESLKRYALLIIDDLGVERESDFMQEQVYNIIDSRYLSGLPFIITTNLLPEELKKTSDVKKMRIYDRILERCHPVEVNGQSYRRQKLVEDFKQMEMLLKG